jgi:hypothetical protein
VLAIGPFADPHLAQQVTGGEISPAAMTEIRSCAASPSPTRAKPSPAATCCHLLPLEQFSDELASAIASVKIIKRNLVSGDGQVDEVHEVRFCD